MGGTRIQSFLMLKLLHRNHLAKRNQTLTAVLSLSLKTLTTTLMSRAWTGTIWKRKLWLKTEGMPRTPEKKEVVVLQNLPEEGQEEEEEGEEGMLTPEAAAFLVAPQREGGV